MPILLLSPLPPRTTKGEILPFVCDLGKIRGEQVGKISLADRHVTIEVPQESVGQLSKALDGAKLKNRRLRVSCLAEVSTTSAEDHFQRLARLVEIESQAELRQTQEELRGLSAPTPLS